MKQTPETAWDACLEIIRDNIPKQSFVTWFEPLRASSLTQEGDLLKLTVQLPSKFYYEWLEAHYYRLLQTIITRVLGPGGRLYYNIVVERESSMTSDFQDTTVHMPALQAANKPHHTPSPPQATVPVVHPEPVNSRLSPEYLFDSFIEGGCNRLARSAAMAIAQGPGTTSFNPFFLYGGAGLGKTHLIQAIGNCVAQNRPDLSVRYVSSEQFTNEFIRAIQCGRVDEFSRLYRQLDVIIIDDVQFFGGKEKTQEEFFHIFNELHQDNKQIILSADRPPRKIKGIEERMLSRFQWGLAADLQPPELETRVAILCRKAEDEGIEFSSDVTDFIACNIKRNVRELQGAIIKLLAYATLVDKDIDLPLAKEALRDMIAEGHPPLSIDHIEEIVCKYFAISKDLVRAKTRKREIVQARQIAMYFTLEFTHHSLKSIGTHFGGRDHSTVIHANRSVKNQMDTNVRFREMVEEIGHKITLQTR